MNRRLWTVARQGHGSPRRSGEHRSRAVPRLLGDDFWDVAVRGYEAAAVFLRLLPDHAVVRPGSAAAFASPQQASSSEDCPTPWRLATSPNGIFHMLKLPARFAQAGISHIELKTTTTMCKHADGKWQTFRTATEPNDAAPIGQRVKLHAATPAT